MVILEPPSKTLALLRSALPESHPGSCNGDVNAKIGSVEDGGCEEILAYVKESRYSKATDLWAKSKQEVSEIMQRVSRRE